MKDVILNVCYQELDHYSRILPAGSPIVQANFFKMNTTFLVLYLAISALLVSSIEGQPILTLTYHHGIKLDSIQEPGSPFMFKQLCTTKVDSIVSSGNVIFKKSKIGKIKNCDFQWQIREDTLRAIVIETFREKNTQQVINQVTSQFGSPVATNDSITTTYEWRRKSEKSDLRAILVVNKKEATGILIVTI